MAKKGLIVSIIACVFFFFNIHNIGAEPNLDSGKLNSTMVNTGLGYYSQYYLLIPDNIGEYKYLSFHPPFSFLFAVWYNEKDFDKLKIVHFKRGVLDKYGTLPYNKIKGFETIAEELKSMDEFSIGDRKQFLISKLKECHSNYAKEYQKFLNGYGGVYHFLNRNIAKNHTYSNVSKKDYNFDKKTFTVRTLQSTGNTDWEVQYANKYCYKYKSKCNVHWNRYYIEHTGFPLIIKIPMPFETAKKLFGDNDKVYSTTILTVKLKPGFIGRCGNDEQHNASRVQNFDILKITKSFFKGKNWSEKDKRFLGDPTLTLEFISNDEHRFH